MIYTLLQKYELPNRDYDMYTLHGYDQSDLSNLIPKSETINMTTLEVKDLCSKKRNECVNFSLNAKGEIEMSPDIPVTVLPDTMIPDASQNYDDVWNVLFLLRDLDALIIISNPGHEVDGFKDDKMTYLARASRLTYSTTHANCTLHYLADGTVYNPEWDSVDSSKRWTTYKIIKDNKLKRKYLMILLDEEGVRTLKRKSTIQFTSFKLSEVCNFPVLSVDDLDTSKDLHYCLLDLESIPLVNVNYGMLSNYHLIATTVRNYNITTMNTKVIKAYLDTLGELFPQITQLMSNDDVYKQKYLPEGTTEKTNGIKFTLSGQSNVPSVNACIKALKNPNITSVADFVNMDKQALIELKDSTYRLNFLQRCAIHTLIHLSLEYIDTKNPDTCYTSLDNIYKMYLEQRELFKARLTHIRSALMIRLHEDMFSKDVVLSGEVKESTVYMSLGKY